MRMAIVGAWPPEQFAGALTLGNVAHQLVLTGTASIVGDVLVGSGGATTGSISGYPTPASLPVKGDIKKINQTALPQYSFEYLNETVRYYKALRSGVVPDSLRASFVEPNAPIADSLVSQDQPLYFMRSAGVRVASTACLSGLITIFSSDTVLIEKGARMHGCVIVGLKGITVRSNGLSSVQLLSSRIRLQSGTRCMYPSLALSLPFDTSKGGRQELIIESGASLDGFAGMVSPRGDDVLEIQEGAHVTGAAYSSARMTLDGSVTGSALGYDFYFYEPPSIYLGWIRKGTVDRSALPEGFLVPPLFSQTRRLGVLDWM
jgi:hypothetical protein